MYRKPYFLARTTGNMELVWKKNNGPQHLTIHASVALLAIYSTYRCICCTLVWFFQEKWVIYLTLEFVVKYYTQSRAFPVLKCFDPRTKTSNYPIPEQIWSHMTRGLFSWQSVQKKGVVKHTRWKKSDMKESYEPFHYSLWRTVCSKRETSR